jgi:outer membrane protein
MLKKTFIFLLLNACSLLYGQQITRFAVVDLAQVYTAFFRESRAVREFEEQSARVQSDIDRMTREIQELRSRHADAVMRDDQNEALRLETQINRRSEFLREYYQTKTAELEIRRSNLMRSGSFLDQVYDEIRFIAESEGYTTVLNLNNNPSIIWYSPSVNITDKLIQNLLTRSSRN